MRKRIWIVCVGAALLSGGCADKTDMEGKPTFMFGCFRKEIVTAEYHIPEMLTPAAAMYIEDIIKRDIGYVDSTFNLDTRMLTVKYYSSRSRKMNYEEAIAYRGFAVNNRPAKPGTKIPEGLN